MGGKNYKIIIEKLFPSQRRRVNFELAVEKRKVTVIKKKSLWSEEKGAKQ